MVGDDRCDAGMAAPVARRHVEQDKISFLIGPLCPAVALDAASRWTPRRSMPRPV
jgi:ABC-type branched-subunit amino acid transport system substrate-binding protein